MKYAIIEAGGKQYRAEEGKLITVDLLPAEIGETIVIDKVVLLCDGDSVTVGTPYIKGASVNTTVDDQIKGKKILVFKYKPRINYRKRAGHRQKYTSLLVDSIVME
ncbi:MAG: 50S ribosomal protein L21 [Anaerolineaceae bacterium]|jgi:large subunit ribosomal protein L21|nr:50S ribosomal protein L21 [Anaerolineaceae bacterium]MDD4043328.1 50S ribosomal protein L21 [Anaerolineaceae bacterium]MDD4577671.1 50S ribosomal protein L21 [Anaerolineaceae bacterium]